VLNTYAYFITVFLSKIIIINDIQSVNLNCIIRVFF